MPFETQDINMSEYLNSARAENFIGRQWLYRELEDTLIDSNIPGVLIIGNPGSGKSALSSQLICSRTTSSRIHSHILGYHLCKYSDKNTQMAGKFVRNLAEMIARRLPEYGYIVTNSSYIQRSFDDDCIQNQDPVGCFEQTIMSPLRNLKNEPRENWYILLDALDECLSQGETSHSIIYLLNSKIHRFPPWLKLIMTSRNESEALLHTSNVKKIVIDPEDHRNIQDIEIFLTERLYPEGPLSNWIRSWFGDDSVASTTRMIRELMSKSQGNFLFVKEVLHHWELSRLQLKDAYVLPKTLGDLYHSYFERLYPDSVKGSFTSLRRVLELLVATVEPLTCKEIFQVLQMSETDLDKEYGFKNRLKELGHFLKYGENDTVTLYHLSLNEWLTSEGNQKFFVSKKKGHEIFCDYYFSLIRSGDKSALSKYILSLAQHIAYGGWKEAYVQEFLNFPSQTVNSSDLLSNRTLLHLAATINSTDVLQLLLRHFSYIDCVDDLGMTPAFLAAKHGLVDNLALLVKKGANVNRKTLSIIAVHKANIRDTLRKNKNNLHLLEIPELEIPVFQSKPTFFNATMLHAAAQGGHLNVVRFLLDNNAVVSTLNGAHLSAIQLAAENGHVEVVKALYEAGAVADQTALHHAAANNKLEVVNFLLSIGVEDVCLRCDGTFHWLKTKRRLQSSPKLSLPLRQRCSEMNGFRITSLEDCIDWEKNWEDTNVGELFDDKHLILCHSALHAAVASGNDKVVSLLLSKENNALTCSDYTGRTPLHEAVRKNNSKIVKILLEKYPTLINRKCVHKQQIATSVSLEDEFLSSNMLSVDEQNEYSRDICHCGYTPLHLAVRYGHKHLGILLILEGAPVNEGDCNGATPFHVAACHNQVDFISIFSLPEVGGDINRETLNGSTPLHSAAACGAVEAIDYLLFHKANTGAVDNDGMTALHYSVIQANSNGFSQRLLLDDGWYDATYRLDRIDQKGQIWGSFGHKQQMNNDDPYQGLHALIKLAVSLDVDAVDFNGQTPLHFAASEGLYYVVRILIHEKATTEKRDNREKTPLDLAVENALLMTDIHDAAYGFVVEFLLSHGASPVKCNRSGSSLLHRAIINQQPYIVQKLLLKGASLSCKDNLGRTPFVTYLQNGGSWTDVIINAFTTCLAIKCGKPFNSSVFHLLSYRPPTAADNNFFHSETCKFYNPAECEGKKGSLAETLESYPRPQEIINSCLDEEGFTPLHRAAQGGNVVAIRYLLANGANDSILSPHGHDALTLAILHAGGKFKQFYESYYSHDTMLGEMQTSDAAIELLHHAMRSRGYRITCDSSKPELTLYHLAASCGLVKFIEVLFKEKEMHQLDVNCPNKDGVTPMYLAKIFGINHFSTWEHEHVIQIIKNHGGEMRYPDTDAEYNIIYNRLYGWISDEFTLNLRPNGRQFITSLLALFEKTENKSFYCSLHNFHSGRDQSTLVEISQIIFSVPEDKQFEAIQEFFMRDLTLCFKKIVRITDLSYLRYRKYSNKSGQKWKSLSKIQQNWFKRKIFILSRMRRVDTVGTFSCLNWFSVKYKSILDTEKLKSLIRHKETPSSLYLISICQDFGILFREYMSHHRLKSGMLSKFRVPDFVIERMTTSTERSSTSRDYDLFRMDEIVWPLKFLLKRSLGLFQKYNYLKTLQEGINERTRVPLTTDQMQPILEDLL